MMAIFDTNRSRNSNTGVSDGRLVDHRIFGTSGPRQLTSSAGGAELSRIPILALLLVVSLACVAWRTYAAEPDCSEFAASIQHLESKVREARRETDLNAIESEIVSGSQWASAELGYLKPRLTLMMQLHDTSALIEAQERINFAVLSFNNLTRLDTEDAVFVVRSFGDAFFSFYREAYALACDAPALQVCSAYAQAIDHLARLALALPEMALGPDEIRSAQEVAFQQADMGLDGLAFPGWQDALKHTEFPFAQDQVMRARTNAAENSRDPDANHRVTNTTLALHNVVYSVFCARPD